MSNAHQLKLQEIDQQLNQILNDPATSFWTQDLISSALKRDCIDVANELEVLSALFSARAKAILFASIGGDNAKA